LGRRRLHDQCWGGWRLREGSNEFQVEVRQGGGESVVIVIVVENAAGGDKVRGLDDGQQDGDEGEEEQSPG
jgi:hypothetical protein